MESMTVPASMERMYQVLAQIGLLLEQERCPEDQRRQIEVSAEELFTNIVSYAGLGIDGMVQVDYGVFDLEKGYKKAVVRFIDQGIPFDPFAKKDPDLKLPLEQRPIGGVGIYMVKRFMDQVGYQYAEGRNITVIEKQFCII